MARLYNLATEGVKAKLGFHVCFGNRFGRSRFDRSYRPYFPGLLKARAEQFVLEFAGRELSELDLWKEYGDGSRARGRASIDVKGFYPDSPEDVAARIRRVLTVCPPEKLYVNPDCGFGWSPALHVQPEGARARRRARCSPASSSPARSNPAPDGVRSRPRATVKRAGEHEMHSRLVLPSAVSCECQRCRVDLLTPSHLYFQPVTPECPRGTRLAPSGRHWLDAPTTRR